MTDPRARILEATVSNVTSTAPTPDPTYLREWNKFKQFVDQERLRGQLPQGDRYLSRDAVDLYFAEVVAHRDRITPGTARRAVSSLQFFSKHEEHVNGVSSFVVESDHVTRSLDAQKRRYFEFAANEAIVEPHHNLPTDVLGDAEHEKVLHQIFSRFANWMDLSLSWTACTSTYVRGQSLRKAKLMDLRLDSSHKRGGSGDSRIVSLVLRGGTQKNKKDKTRVVGAYRHRNYMRCMTGILALTLLFRLHFNRDIDFYRVGETSKWRGQNLITGWKDQKSHEAAYRALLFAADVTWSKITHLRKTGMEQGSAFGDLNVQEMATMSKHMTAKIFQYATELYAPVMHVMSGFARDDSFFVPRCDIVFPDEWGDITKLVFPNIDIWRAQADAPNGDKSNAAKNFLYEMLPFLALVVVQDGIFWLRDWPEHPISKFLLTVMPPTYERWAAEKRAEVEQVEVSRSDSAVATLNGAAQASYDRLARQNVDNGKKIDALSKSVQDLTNLLLQQRTASASLPAPTAVRPSLEATLRNTPLMPSIPTAMPESMSQLRIEHECLFKLDRFAASSSRRGWSHALNLAYSRRRYLYEQLIARANRQRNGYSFERRKELAAKQMDEEIVQYSLAGTSQYHKFLKDRDPSKKPRAKRTSK